MTDIYDISSIPARFAAEVTWGAENATAAQNMVAARATLPEEIPDYAGMPSARTTYPAGEFHGTIRGRDSVTDALNSPWGRDLV